MFFQQEIILNKLKIKTRYEAVLQDLQASSRSFIKNKEYEALLNMPSRRDDIPEIVDTAQYITSNFKNLVVLGMGGSILNPQTIVALSNSRNVFMVDTIDPGYVYDLLESLDIEKTAFLVISKSGNTLEVLGQVLSCIGFVKEKGDCDLSKHFIFISDPIPSPMRKIATKIGAKILDHEKDIGGRYASLTNISLIPAIVAGLDHLKIREGAAYVMENFLSQKDSLPLQGAAMSFAALSEGITSTVIMPYAKKLEALTSWHSQIWAESLGKDGKGSTPIRAMGTIDQHSQLQLYLDGPQDKMFTLIGEKNSHHCKIDDFIIDDLAYLSGKSLSAVNRASQIATTNSLVEKGVPVRTITIDVLNEYSMGALIMHFILETLVMSELLNVNPFGQPAVENGKSVVIGILKDKAYIC